MPRDDFAARTLAAIGQQAYLDEPVSGVELVELPWVASRLTTEALERLQLFFHDMSERPPMTGPAWYAHREFLEALGADLRREIARRG